MRPQSHDPARWRAYRRQTVDTRHVIHYLLYVESHSGQTREDLDALEQEKDNIFAAMDQAFRNGKWRRYQRFAQALCREHGLFHVRGDWARWRRSLEQAITAARNEQNHWAEVEFVQMLHTMSIASRENSPGPLLESLEVQLESLPWNDSIMQALAAMAAVFGAGDAAGGYEGPGPTLSGLIEKDLQESPLGSADLLQLVTGRQLPKWFKIHERRRARSLTHRANLSLMAGHFQEAKVLLQESEAVLARWDDAKAQAVSQVNQAIILDLGGEQGKADQLYNEHLEAALQSSQEVDQAYLLRLKGMRHLRRDELPEAERLLSRSRELFEAMGFKAEIAKSLHLQAELEIQHGRLLEARQLLLESLVIEENLDKQDGICHALYDLASLALRRNEYSEAECHCDRGLAICASTQEPIWQASFLRQRGRISHQQGRHDIASRNYAESLRLLEQGDSQGELGAVLRDLGELGLDLGHDELAKEYFLRAYGLAKKHGDMAGMGKSALHLGQLFALSGESDAAERVYHEGIVVSRTTGDRAREGVILYCLARLYAAQRRWDEARRTAEQAYAIAERGNLREWIAALLDEVGQTEEPSCL
ncbi:MAG TPA: hypothetical protein VEW48_12375 [Thermoanaerobaculia bacterium]|nr:hypothetical protein [Thermoanaerobaculia bacterium]